MTPPADRVVTTKWGGRPHWEFDALLLGDDEHGTWLGVPVGTHFVRPGHEFTAGNLQVTLVPAGRWWVATFHGEGQRGTWPDLDGAAVDVYVDVATPVVWQGDIATSIDLDLDVVRGSNGLVIVDDEDEFAEHQVAFGYPAEVIASAEAACAELVDLIRSGTPPFDAATSASWLERLLALTSDQP